MQVALFNNRELAAFFWCGLLLAWAFSKTEIRDSLGNLLRTFFQIKIVIPTLLMISYVTGIAYVLFVLGLWDQSNLKFTIYWTLGGGFVLFLNVTKALEDDNFFRMVVFNNLKLIVLLEFLVNLYVFDLWVEFITVPIISILVATNAFAETKSEYKPAHKLLSTILTMYGAIVLFYSIRLVIGESDVVTSVGTLKDFLLPILFTFGFIPFLYVLALYAKYELVFTRLHIFNDENAPIRFAKLKILQTFHFNLLRLNKWSRTVRSMKVVNKSDVVELLRK